MSAHRTSPGPFHVERPYEEKGVYIVAADTSIVARVFQNEIDPAACCANGNGLLLGASHDMLAALELICANAGESPEWIRARIAPAIAKARGITANPTPEPAPRPRSLSCCVCGTGTRGVQWWNRDTGYGICTPCADREARREPPAVMQSYYGVRGVNYDVPSNDQNREPTQ